MTWFPENKSECHEFWLDMKQTLAFQTAFRLSFCNLQYSSKTRLGVFYWKLLWPDLRLNSRSGRLPLPQPGCDNLHKKSHLHHVGLKLYFEMARLRRVVYIAAISGVSTGKLWGDARFDCACDGWFSPWAGQHELLLWNISTPLVLVQFQALF